MTVTYTQSLGVEALFIVNCRQAVFVSYNDFLMQTKNYTVLNLISELDFGINLKKKKQQ